MKPLTLMLKELIEMTGIMQFRYYFKFFRMGLYKLMCKNQTTMTIFSIMVICFKEKAALHCIKEKAALHCINAMIRSLQKVPIVRSNTYDFFH